MHNFTYYAPTKVVFGKGVQQNVAKLLKEFNATKVLVHYGSGSVVKTGLLEEVETNLRNNNIEYVTLGGVVANPRLSLVREGIELCKKENVDFILAVGGGSVIDSAKAIGWGVKCDFDVWELFEGVNQATDTLPIGCILTIAAAGSEMSRGSVITNENGDLKRSYSMDESRPKFALLNPELTMTLPDYQTACGCVDIIMHTLERYFSQEGMDVSDGISESLIKTVMKNATILHDDPNNYEARAQIMWAGSLSHNGLVGCGNSAGDWATHGLEHELSGMFDVAHGAGLSAIWPTWARYVYQDCMPRFVQFARNVMDVEEGEDISMALQGIDRLEAFFASIDMPITICGLGVIPTIDQLQQMAKSCSQACGGTLGSTKELSEEDMFEIYKMAF